MATFRSSGASRAKISTLTLGAGAVSAATAAAVGVAATPATALSNYYPRHCTPPASTKYRGGALGGTVSDSAYASFGCNGGTGLANACDQFAVAIGGGVSYTQPHCGSSSGGGVIKQKYQNGLMTTAWPGTRVCRSCHLHANKSHYLSGWTN